MLHYICVLDQKTFKYEIFFKIQTLLTVQILFMPSMVTINLKQGCQRTIILPRVYFWLLTKAAYLDYYSVSTNLIAWLLFSSTQAGVPPLKMWPSLIWRDFGRELCSLCYPLLSGCQTSFFKICHSTFCTCECSCGHPVYLTPPTELIDSSLLSQSSHCILVWQNW